MRREKWVTALWSVVFGFLLSFSAVAGLASAFEMQVPMLTLAWACLAAALIGTVCYSLPIGLLPPAAFAFVLGFYYRTGGLVRSVESLLYRLSRQYHQGYGWPILRWSGRTAEQMEQTLPLILCLVGIWIGISVCRGICRKKPMFFGIFADIVCLAVCFVVNDTPPDTIFLFLQISCLLVLLLTGGVRRRDAAQGNRLTLMTLPLVALALLVLLACVSRQDYSNANAVKFSKWFTEGEIIQTLLGNDDSGVSQDKVDLTQEGYRASGKSKVMEVKADYSGTLYLRSRCLDYYDGISWTEGGAYKASDLNWPADLETAGVVEITTRFAHSMLYVPYYAASSNMRESTFGVENGNKLTEYSFSTLAMPTPGELEQYHVNSSGLQYYMSQYIALPEQVQKWAAPLVQKLAGEGYDVLEIAQNVASFVKSSAAYDTNTPPMPSREKDFARWFLEDSDTGYCVHFATSAAVLLQAAGIPARYVTGYMVQAVAGETVEVTGQQAHAWCEYWLPGFGWTVLEATPADLQSETTQPTAGEEMVQITPTNPQNQQTQPQQVTVTKNLWPLALVLVVAVAVVWCQYILRKYLRKRHCRQGSTNARALAHWQYAEVLAHWLHQTPPEALQRVAEKARFSQHTLTEEELDAFTRYENDAVARLKKKNVCIRLYHCLVLALY